MLVTVGDLVEDMIVLLHGPVNIASDTDVTVTRRRGGSAANMASTAARLGHSVRFIGQVGDDDVGSNLVATLTADGVEVVVRRHGRSGTIVCLVDAEGERTMLSDRGACIDLSPADATWLDGARTLHLPLYSLAVEPLATTSIDLVRLAHERGVRVSLDASSVSVMEGLGRDHITRILSAVRPDVLLCNDDEAHHLGELGHPDAIGGGLVVVKRGSGPATALGADGTSVSVAAPDLGRIADTTGAGDAFAAGFLVALAAGDDAATALAAGHSSAGRHLLANGDDPKG